MPVRLFNDQRFLDFIRQEFDNDTLPRREWSGNYASVVRPGQG